MSEHGEVEVENPSAGFQALPKDALAEMGTVKLFNKWSYEDVEIRDISLTDYIQIRNPVYIPHTAGRYAAKRFRKAQCPIIERLTNSLMMNGRNNGKKLMAVRIVAHAFEIIHIMTDQNPLQVAVDAIVNCGPREDSTRIGSAGTVRRQAVDVSPLRRVNQAIALLTIGAREASFRNIKSIAECLAEELINAAKGSSNSYAIKKKDELERVAKSNRPNLQHKIRRDPKSYIEDFRAQHYQYESHREIFMAAPTAATDTGIISLRELIDFIAHVADCYPTITNDFPQQLIDILTQHHLVLEPELREKIVGSLVLLRKKELLDSATLLQTLFPILITTPSKTLRALIFQKILMDLRSSNAKTTNHKLNRTMQTVLFNLVTSDRTSSKGLWAIKLTRELWKRQIWTDAKAVEVMKEATLSENEKVIVGGVRFFLGGDKEREEMEDESSDEEAIDLGRVKHQVGINKKTRKKSRAVEKAKATVKKRERKKNQPHPLNFSALHLLHDPQGFAEALFSKHLQNTKSNLNLDQKLLVLQLVSRLVGLHRLHIMHLYSYFQKYLTPRQASVTSFLASLAQASHDLVPPDVLEPLVQKIANEFVSEAAASEVATAGLNAIREICARQPLAMNETLLQDLVMYRKSKDKGVVMAARGLLSLYRDVGADMLKRRDRGKEASMSLRAGEKKERRFGEQQTGEIEGLELLEKWKEEERRKRRIEKGLPSDAEDDEDDEAEDDAAWDKWNIEDDEDSDDSGGWIDVQSDAEIELSDSDDDDSPPAKKAKQGEEEEDKAKSETKKTNLATTRILTPADLAKLAELRNEAAVNSLLPKRLRSDKNNEPSRHADDPLTAAEIEGLAALSAGKATREERIAHAKEGKDRSEYKSVTARRKERKEAQGKSTTNKEKARRKNLFMTLGKAKSKGKRSLVETRNVLRAHQQRQKRGGRRGNVGS
ncbi:Severe Depolymerization of Actin [Aspergillus turcosus]|uniref:Severe Depolymerization of Actin n=1 Tax=Aspergillus turcosus TaxID=1245748 RepID=A0A397HZ39_9EURO|nr:Severe Depolymerization of Actin [Aspergillus turcosus]RLL99658.1 Severe Depolymerization of Actin [Aspergillus turcosus]